jgi:hypothetical protein
MNPEAPAETPAEMNVATSVTPGNGFFGINRPFEVDFAPVKQNTSSGRVSSDNRSYCASVHDKVPGHGADDELHGWVTTAT